MGECVRASALLACLVSNVRIRVGLELSDFCFQGGIRSSIGREG